MFKRTTQSRRGSSKSWKLFFLVLIGSLLLIEQIGAAKLHLSSRIKRTVYDGYDYENENNSSFEDTDDSIEFNVEAEPETSGNQTVHKELHHEHEEVPAGQNEQEDEDPEWDESVEDNTNDDSKMHHHPIHHNHDHHGHHPPPPAGPRSLNTKNESLPTDAQKESVSKVPVSHESNSAGQHEHHHHHHHNHNNNDDPLEVPDVSHHQFSDLKKGSNGGVIGKENTVVASEGLEKEANANFHIWVGAGLVVLLIGIAIVIMVVLNNMHKRKYGRVSEA